MFGGLGKLAQLLANPQAIKQQAEEMRTRLAEMRIEGISAEGYVRVVVSGDHRVISVMVSEHLPALHRSDIEQHIHAALERALVLAREATSREISAMTGQLGLPGIENFLKA
jgi:DNA-binding protein YbaB